MIIRRRQLLNKLETLAPAVGNTGRHSVPVLTHLQFTGSEVVANNDRIAIRVPMKTEFIGGIPGRPLRKIVAESRAPFVELLADGNNAIMVKLGKTRIGLGMLRPDRFDSFKMPAPAKQNCVTVPAEFFQGIAQCLQSIDKQPIVPDQMGITIVPDGKFLLLYSTDTRTMTHAKLKLREPTQLKNRIILSTDFCQQMLRMRKDATDTQFMVRNDHALFTAGTTTLFGRLIELEGKPLAFERALEHFLPSDKEMVAIPPKLRLMIERSTAFFDIRGQQVPVDIHIRDGRAQFRTLCRLGEMVDTMILPSHPDAHLRICPSLLLKAVMAFDQVLFTDKGAVMAKGGLIHVMAAYPTPRSRGAP